MGNTIDYGCKGECDYHESMHGVGQYQDGDEKGKNRSIYSEKFKKCRRCTRPTIEKMNGKGWYGKDNFNPPQASGGIVI